MHCITQIESVANSEAKSASCNAYVHLENAALLLDPTAGDLSALLTSLEPRSANGTGITVQRPVLTQQAFDQLHEPKSKSKKSVFQWCQLAFCKFRCDRKQAKKRVMKLLPSVNVVRKYDVRNWLLVDVICGLT